MILPLFRVRKRDHTANHCFLHVAMAELGGLAARRFLFRKAIANSATVGIRARCLAQAHNLAAETPYYRKPWRICVAVLLERKPVISREFNELEHKFAAYQNALEFEQSCLSEHEAKKIKMAKGSKLTKKKPTEAEEQKRLEFEQEFGKIEDEEAEISEELEQLKLADRRTEADANNMTGSLERLLDHNLHLIIQQGDKWLLPETEIVGGESLRQAAERLIKSQSQTDVTALVLSNAPSGVYTEEVDAKFREESNVQGKKVFFYKAILQQSEQSKDGFPEFNKDSRWLTLNELQTVFPRQYLKQILKFAS